jgi:pimeloyl-ACP methyl ester carboxylesterase
MTEFLPRKVMLLGLLFCGITSAAANAITSDPFLNPYDVVKTPQTDYVLYEPPFWYVFWGGPVRPVAIYLHGALANDESKYERMLTDMAHAGFVVVFPRYDGWSGNQWYEDAKTKTTAALEDLRGGRVGYLGQILGYPPDTSRWAVVGHSAGGMYSLKLANDAQSSGLGSPTAVILHDAGGFGDIFPLLTPRQQRLYYYIDGHWDFPPEDPLWLDDLSQIPRNTLVVLLAAEYTWMCEVEEHFDGDGIELGNSAFSGVWSRAWHNTVNVDRSHKLGYVVPGGHNDVQNGSQESVYAAYREITINGLRAACGYADYDPDLTNVHPVGLYLDWLFYPKHWVDDPISGPWWLRFAHMFGL